MKKQLLIPVLILCFCFNVHAQKDGAGSWPGVAVIELFTSQGDINCPPADRLLSEIIADANRLNKPVICISMHVDFWNRFGWKDPFSSFKYTNRLKNYTSVLGMKETYTPFMLLNGRKVMEGTDFRKAVEMIDRELLVPAKFQPESDWQVFDDTLDVTYDMKAPVIKGKSGSDIYINVVIADKERITKVTKGDNAGNTLKNENVCLLLHTSDLKAPKGLLRIPLKGVKPAAGRQLMVFVQEKSTRKILGASVQPFQKRP